MRKHIRFTALLLAVSLLFNTALPVIAEGSLDTPTAVEETVSATEAATVSSQETIAPSEETSAPSEENSVPTEETSVATVETSEPAEETTAPTEEISEPTEPSLPQPIAAGTVVCNSSVNIRSGPGTGYEILDVAYNGQRISIYEIVTTQEGDWGRIGEGRWICLTYVSLDGQEPTEETTAPAEEITVPTEAETTPTEESSAPTEEVTDPTEESSAPTEEVTDPTEESSAPTEEATDPTEESSAPTEEITDPTEESSAPTEEITDPTEESSVPTEEITDPTEESSAPTEETTDPLTELEVQLATISVSIQFAEVVPEEMSLTWWAMNCGKMQTDLLLVAENMLAASPEGVVLPEDAIPQDLLYQPENNTLFISSAKDLVYLSYVDPSEYQQMTLRFLPSQQENRGFYLIDPIDELRFSPLGSPEAPFRGKLIFHEQTGPIQLDCPLFDALSDEVKIEDLILECRAEDPMEGGLLAKWIAHTYGGAEWDVTLSAPEMEEDAVAYLPSLVGGLSSESDITLTLTNESGLRVIGSGFLCAQMGMNAKFTVSGLSVLPTVTGYGENVGGLVGQMQAGSILLVSGESLVLSQVTGSQNVGGIVGAADNPNLSLPTIVGAEGAAICGQNVGALVGNLTLSNATHAITQNASNLTLNGSTNTGGLFGILTLNDATLSLTTSLDGLSFGVENLGSNGSIFGTFQASTLKNTLILNGESINDRTGFEGLAGSILSEDPVVTVEEVQQMMDQLASAELVPGGMSLAWWAVVCEKVTAEEIAAEINGTPLPSEATEPTQEPEQPSETTPAAQEPEQTIATEPIVQTDAPEETTLPQDSPSREEYPDAQEDILSQEDVLLEEYVPMAAAFSLSSEGSATTFSKDGEDASTLTPEEDDSVTDVVQDENVPVLLEADETESEESNTENGIMFLTDVGGNPFVNPDYLSIGSAADLVRLSYVAASDYQDKTLLITATTGDTNIHDVTGPVPVTNYGNLSFLGLGSEDAPFEGELIFGESADSVKFKLDRPFFNYLADSTTINVNLYASIADSSTRSALLAGTVTHKEGAPGSWNVKLWGNGNSYPLLGTMVDFGENESNRVTAKVTLTLNVGTFNGEQFTPNADYSALTVLGGGYLCGTMGKSAALEVTLQAVEGTALSIPEVSNSSGDAGSLVGTMGSSASLTVTLPSDYDALPISNVTTSGNAGGMVGKMDTGSTVSVKKADSSPAKITTTGVTITGNNAGGLVGYMEGETTLTADWSSFTAPTVTATEYAGGLAGYAKDPGTIFQNISVTGATITGKKAGGLIGWLDNTKTASFTLNANVQDLTISGSESSGGLFGELHNDKGTDESIAYSISKTESGSISNITLTGKDAGGNASGNAGGLIGKYYTNDLKNTLKIENISVTSSSSAKNYGGVIGKVDGSVAAYVEFSNVSSTSSEPSSTYFGGLIGWLSDAGHMVKIGDVAINATSSGFGSSGTGGLIGNMPNGVLFITGNSSPELNYGTIINKNANTRGWILGNRGNTLVFTDIPNRNAEEGSETNDTGVWGQVLRVDSLPGLFDTGITDTGVTKSISEYISENHFVTISKISQETIPDAQGTSITALAINNVVDFAKVALRLQLDETSSLKFAKVNDTDASGDLDTSGTITISLKASIDLNNTGVTGLTRDVNKDNTFSPVFNIHIIGTLTEKVAPTITLPTLKVYTTSGSHDRQGLIAKAGTLTVANLTLATTPTTDGVQTHLINDGNTYTGLLAAEVSGNVTLNNVTSSAKLKITGSAGNNKSRAAGLIAQITANNTTIKFDGCTWCGTIQDDASGNDRCAGFLAYSEKSGTQYTVKNCYVKGTINKTQKVDYVSVGGLISALSRGTGIQLNIDGLEVKNADIITAGSNAGDKCGGLLGYEWFNVTATLSNITVTGSSLNAGNSNFGGLVYKGSGYWQIGKKDGDTYKPGITFGSGNRFTGASPEGAPSGLFICHGDKVDNDITQSALYLEVLPEAYTVDSSVSVTISTNYFDELVGTSIGSGGNGIVSIATAGHAPIDLEECNTYKKQLSTDYNNSNTRYYYNLDKFRTEVNEDIDTPAEMVVLSARGHCHSGLQTYFTLGNNTITDTIDLSGYSYYPIPFSGQSISDATITLDYEGLETAEGASTTDLGTTIPENKKPSNEDRQHYEMHTGLFTNVGSESANASLTIQGLTLKGTVGGSAIINGKAEGKAVDAVTVLNLENINLDGIRTPSDALKPLLIQDIGNYTTLKMDGVTTIGTEYAGFQRNAEGNSTAFNAATSLIGNVGSATATDIKLEFLNIKLDGRDANGAQTRHNTYRTIFSEALFLQDFQYPDGNPCQGTYNFTDDGANGYTLGQELSNTSEVNSRNNKEQYYFFRTSDEVCKTEFSESSDPATAFATGFLRYVKNHEGSPNGTHHEMDINLSKPDLTKGCGTYSDPYLIESGKQLQAVANALFNSGAVDGWTITLNVGSSGVLIGSGSYGPQNGHTEADAKNPPEGWKDLQYTRVNGVWKAVIAENNSSEAGSSEAGSSEAGTPASAPPEFADSDILLYLRNAYYKIEDNIELPTDWAGLGEPTTSQAFSGVIVGNTGSNPASNFTVTINTSSSIARFGGLIKYSQGSVVKGLNIHYESAPTITCDTVPSTLGNASFFGGVVGWCMGGDTIIDGVTVTCATAPSVSGTYHYLSAVGGYVGLVGGTEGLDSTTNGLGGGVVFRNFTGTGLSGVTYNNKAVGDTYFYINPYVGRVLDGYALSEGGKLENTDKNYQIPGISSISSHLGMTGNQVTVNDADGLWLLSAITNSGTGNAASCNAYKVGKARTCDYGNVGQAPGAGDLDDETDGTDVYLGGDASKSKPTSYLGFSTLTGGNAVSIVLASDCDMSSYGNGFRGIGTSYGGTASNSRLMKVSSLTTSDGNVKKVKLAQDRKEYTQEKDSWSSIGSGLFVLLSAPAGAAQTFKNLEFSGKTGISYYNGTTALTGNTLDNERGRIRWAGAGALAANLANGYAFSIQIDNVSLNQLKVNTDGIVGSTYAGGLIGAASYGTYGGCQLLASVTLNNCTYDNLTVTGRSDVGGFLGFVYASSVNVTYTRSATLKTGKITSTATTTSFFSGTGGLIGQTEKANVTITGVASDNPTEGTAQQPTRKSLTFYDLTVESKYNDTNSADKAQSGGLIGLLSAPYDGNVTIKNLSMEGATPITGGASGGSNTSAGGLVGALVCMKYSGNNRDWDWNSGGNVTVNISDVWIAQEGTSKMTVQNFRQGGGLIGILAADKGVTISNVKMGSEKGTVTIHNAYNKTAHCEGGFVGAVIKPNMNIKDSQVTNTTVKAQYNTDRGSALLVGYSEKAGTIDIRNMAMESCKVLVGQTDFRSALLYGHLKDGAQTITGTNILARNCMMGYTTDWSTLDPSKCTKMGIWGGSANSTSDKTVYLVGMSLWNNTTPAKDFGYNTPTKSYVIRADYLANQTGNKNFFHDDAYCASPFVTTSPIMSFAGIGYRSSDGVAFVEGNTSIAQKIVQDYLDGAAENRIYFNVKTAMDYFCSTTDGSKAVNTSYFSTFNTAGENTFSSDFPVLVINSTEAKNADAIVKNYISLLTNESSAALHFKKIVSTSYTLTESSFVKTVSGKESLTVGSDNSITVGTDKYDNQEGKFTLLDVQYSDPAGGDIIAYHLYIPVIVKKVLEFKFWAAAENGTTYKAENYDKLSLSAIGSNKDQITALLTFEYQRSQEEWQTAVNNGDNLLWNFKKQVTLSKSGGDDFTSAKMTLVDRNDKNRAYYLDYAGGNVNFSDFTSVSDGTNWAASNMPLCDLLDLTAEPWSEGAKNKYVQLGNQAGASLRVGNEYYRLAEDSDDGDNFFSINVGPKGNLAQETYYLTIQTKVTGSTVYNFLITCSDHLTGPIDIDGNVATGMPTTRINARNDQSFARNSGENRVVISNFFTQDVTVTTTSAPLMSDTNKIIEGTLETTITFASTNARDIFKQYAVQADGKTPRNLYQCFRLFLKRVDENGIVRSDSFAAGTTLNSEPVGLEGVHRLPSTEEIKSLDGTAENGLPCTTVRTPFTLEYTTQGIIDQFPTRITSTDKNGIQVWAESILSLDKTALERSNLRETGNDNQTFYRNDVGLATLSYNAYDDTLPTQASGLSKLGINGWDPSDTRINSVAGYNCSAVTGASSADTLKLDVQLYRKDDGGAYIPLEYSSYMDLSRISARVMGTGTITPKEGDRFSFQLENFDGINPILIEIDLDVKTGSELEAIDGGTYANYKVKLTASLYGSNDLISHSQADDYIIYTNAKIISSLIS